MTVDALAIGHAGFVRAVVSRRGGGWHAAPVDLMRAHLRAVRAVLIRRRNDAVCERLAAEFDGYLVSDSPCDSPCGSRGGVSLDAVFSARRGRHAPPAIDRIAVTGARSWPFEMRVGCGVGGSLDAPVFLAGGGMRDSVELAEMFGGSQCVQVLGVRP